jgi:sec-independent protein translocase protein TatA
MGAPEILLILLIVVLLFGATRIPKVARSLGESRKEFKSALDEPATGEPTESDTSSDTSPPQ